MHLILIIDQKIKSDLVLDFLKKQNFHWLYFHPSRNLLLIYSFSDLELFWGLDKHLHKILPERNSLRDCLLKARIHY